MSSPEISVVMGVHNGESSLAESVHSILSQDGVDLELIAVDDGSTDRTTEILRELAATDPRLRTITIPKSGLTQALIQGCAAARGHLIARQDCGDKSLPGRLLAQQRSLDAHPDAVLSSCGVRFTGPAGERLYEASMPDGDGTEAIATLVLGKLRGPQHGTAMFRRAAYQRAGGYRKEFYFAQDLDLWTRLAEIGRHWALAEVMYEANFDPKGITGSHRRLQQATKRIIVEAARLRRAGLSEESVLEQAAAIRAAKASPRDTAAALYFLGSCLARHHDPEARRYFLQALHVYPLHLRAAFRLIFRR